MGIKNNYKIVIVLILTLIFLNAAFTFSFAGEKIFPPDAADEQIYFQPISGESGTYMDLMKSVNNCVSSAVGIVNESLFRLDKELNVIPMGAEGWKLSEDGLKWTFNLKTELKWSDGEPLTAHDYVFALQRAVEQGYDFGWYWKSAAGIKNWEEVESGLLTVEELGIRAIDDYTLEITTNIPKPYLNIVLTKLYPVPRHAVSKNGDEYAAQAETMVGNGPFKVDEWVKGSHIIFTPNPNYRGIWEPYLKKIVLKYGTYDAEAGFFAYLNDEIFFSHLNSGQLAYVKQNIPEQLNSWPAFRIYYLTFDTTKPPFDDVRVRQAFNYVLNREELCSTVLKGVGIPEYSVLMTGFPGNDPFETKNILKNDSALARKLLAEAGYPEGKGFPKLELWVRKSAHGETETVTLPAATYLQAQFKEKLGIDIVPRVIEGKTYTEALNQNSHNFFLNSYGFDYVDPSNFMDLFISDIFPSWSNPLYDSLVLEADSIIDWDQRIDNYRKAEKILADEIPLIPIFQRVNNIVIKPFLKGKGIEPDKNGINSWDLNLMEYILTHIYISK